MFRGRRSIKWGRNRESRMLTKQWYREKYHLDRMVFRDLMWAYVSYPSIQVYALLLVSSIILAIVVYPMAPVSPMRVIGSFLGTLLAYPFVEYTVHRFIQYASNEFIELSIDVSNSVLSH